jgi:chromosome segregation ATPase
MASVRATGFALAMIVGLLTLGLLVKTTCVRAEDAKPVDLGAQVLTTLDTTYKDLVKRQLLSSREATAPLAQLEAMAWELRILSNQYVEVRQQADLLQRRLAIAQKETQDQVGVINDLQGKVKALEAQLASAGKVSQKPAPDQ